MKANKKIMDLLNHGFSNSLLSTLNERQVDSLYQRLVESKKESNEQVTTQTMDVQKIGPEGGQIKIDPTKKTLSLTKDPNAPNTFKVTQTESEMSEESDTDLALAVQSQEVSEKFESKKQQKYFWYKCGEGKTKEQKKWCKMAKEFSDSTKNFSKLPEKKETKEDYTDMIANIHQKNMSDKINKITPSVKFGESKIERTISKLVEKHLPPKMNKKDLMNIIFEAEKEVETPVKPDVKPDRPKPQTPYQPKHKPAPKAGEKEVETPVKPDVKPDRPKPQTPYQPKHKPAPKAEDVPQWLTFDAIGINLK